MEEYIESELSGIFRVKLVTKNIERGSPGTQFMHMRVKKYLMISTISRLETVNKSVSKNFCDVFVFTKGKVCKYFIY